MDLFFILVVVIVIMVLVLIFMGVRSVPQGSEWTVERFGRYTSTLNPGLHVIFPFIDVVGERLNMKEQVLDVPTQEVITKDNAMVAADAVVFYQIVDAKRAAYEVNDRELAITNLAQTNVRTVIGSMDLDEVLAKRDEINTRLLRVIDDATNPWGIKVTRVEIKDLTPPMDITEAMARQMKAERIKRAQILEAEGDKQSAVLRAEGMKQSAILEAEGNKEAAFRDAEAREREAEAEARATDMVSNAIADGNVQAINYFVAQKYVDALEAIASAPNEKVILMPMEATGILGALGGVGELAKSAFGGGGSSVGSGGTPRGTGGSAPRGGDRPTGTPTASASPVPTASGPGRTNQADVQRARQTLWDNIEAQSNPGPWGRS